MTWSDRTPIVVFGDDWGRRVSTLQHLFRRIIPIHPVIWVNAIGHRIPRLRRADVQRAFEKARAMLHAPERTHVGMNGINPHAIVEPRVLPWHHLPTVRAFNAWSLRRSIRARLRSLGITDAPILVTGSPASCSVVGRLGERAAVYFCMDDFLHTPGTSPEVIGPLEQQLLESVDAVIATARTLTEKKIPASGRIHYLPQGVSYDHFADPRPEPSEFKNLPRPIIGFAGGLYTRCDLGVINRLAAEWRHGSVVLVGPIDVDVSPLTEPNIHLLGPRLYSKLPSYVQHFDVGIIPYVLNDETRSVDPLKLLEYMAAGVPVVSSDIPEARKYENIVCVAADADGFVDGVKRALDTDRNTLAVRGQAVAREHTWERRAETLLELLRDVMNSRLTPSR